MKNNITKLWQKDWKLNSFVESFETKDDILLDQKLTVFDIAASLAHAQMLKKIGILNEGELKTLTKGFKKIYNLHQNGEFTLSIGDEDIHTKIENYLIKEYGNVGKKIHTGRSRNDQILVAMRLFTKGELLEISESLFLLTNEFIKFAKENEDIEIPGYTHMQKAMPYTLGAWAEAYVSAFCDDFALLQSAISLIDQSPLGSAAGFGSPIDLDKKYTANKLGFERVQENALYAQSSRGKFESIILATLVSILSDLNKFASDIMLFTTSEFDLLTIDPSLCTGSSIMPQKKNVDIAELIRSKVHLLLGNYIQITSLSTNLISGYNRDSQDMKKPLMEGLEIADITIQAAKFLILGIKPNKEKLKSSLTPEIYATHITLSLSKKGMSFRDAYKEVSKNIKNLKVTEDIKSKIPLNINYFSGILNTYQKKFSKDKKDFYLSINNLLEGK